jgi:hypothetical protein
MVCQRSSQAGPILCQKEAGAGPGQAHGARLFQGGSGERGAMQGGNVAGSVKFSLAPGIAILLYCKVLKSNKNKETRLIMYERRRKNDQSRKWNYFLVSLSFWCILLSLASRGVDGARITLALNVFSLLGLRSGSFA